MESTTQHPLLDAAHPWAAPPSSAERLAAGKAIRARTPRNGLGTLAPRTRDALAILDEQNATRLPELVSLRVQRMAESAFAFYRGSAAIMAADLAVEPNTGIFVPSCGDAHLANFGFYASPQRSLVFDLNDFDEAAWAPWEWDLKRLATSVILAARFAGRDEQVTRDAVLGTVRAYAAALRATATMSPLDRFYAHFEAETGIDNLPESAKRTLQAALKQARKRTTQRATKKLAVADDDGRLRFVPRPPTMLELPSEIKKQVYHLLHRYTESSSPEIRQLLHHFTVSDAIRRVVGVGSVGTRCSLTLFQDGDGHTLILQAKQAGRSVLEQYGGIAQPRELEEQVAQHGEGARVVRMQRVLQALSDPFLGYLRADGIDLYVRQFHDMKGGIDADTVDDESFNTYARSCGLTLARAHSQSQLSAIVSGCIGGGWRLGEAIWEWGNAYAERVESDHRAFCAQHRELLGHAD